MKKLDNDGVFGDYGESDDDAPWTSVSADHSPFDGRRLLEQPTLHLPRDSRRGSGGEMLRLLHDRACEGKVAAHTWSANFSPRRTTWIFCVCGALGGG